MLDFLCGHLEIFERGHYFQVTSLLITDPCNREVIDRTQSTQLFTSTADELSSTLQVSFLSFPLLAHAILGGTQLLTPRGWLCCDIAACHSYENMLNIGIDNYSISSQWTFPMGRSDHQSDSLIKPVWSGNDLWVGTVHNACC